MWPSAESSTGPVKTSPEGMLRRPSEFTHVRPATLRRRSVPSASMRSSLATARRSISCAWCARSSPQAATGSSRSRNSARSTSAAKSPVAIPACCAPAGVGHSVPHQRRCIASSRTGARVRAARAIRAGSTPASSLVLSGAWIVSRQSAVSVSACSPGDSVSRWTSRAAAQ